MSVNYTSVIGVGVPEEDITYKSLSEKGKEIIQASYMIHYVKKIFMTMRMIEFLILI